MGFFFFAPSPLLFFLPLMALLAWSRPAAPREWWWLTGTTVLCGVWLVFSGGITDQVANAGAVLATGAFLCLLRFRPGTLFPRALWATTIGVAAVALWCHLLGITWGEIELALTREWWSLTRLLADRANRVSAAPDTMQVISQLADAGRPLAQLFPGRLFLSGMLGLVLASVWQYRITGRTHGLRWASFREFRFSDHLVWMLILSLAVLLVPTPDVTNADSPVLNLMVYGVKVWAPVAANVLEVCVALYAARGAAVVASFMKPRTAAILLVIGAVFLLPFVVIGLASLGLADTWAGFRQRLRTAGPVDRRTDGQ